MTEKKLYLGSTGPFLFDDDDPVEDEDGDFAGETHKGLITNGPIYTTQVPVQDNDVVRLEDLLIGWSYVSDIKTSDYTILLTDYIVLINCTYRNIDIYLPSTAETFGKSFEIVRIDDSNNLLTVIPNEAETINGEVSQILYAEGDAMHIISNAKNWYII